MTEVQFKVQGIISGKELPPLTVNRRVTTSAYRAIADTNQ